MLKNKLSLLIAIYAVVSNANCQDIKLSNVVVHAGEFARDNTVVGVSLEGLEFDQANKKLKVYEVKGKNKELVKSHIEQGYYARLWWVLSGSTKKNSKRKFEIVLTALDALVSERRGAHSSATTGSLPPCGDLESMDAYGI